MSQSSQHNSDKSKKEAQEKLIQTSTLFLFQMIDYLSQKDAEDNKRGNTQSSEEMKKTIYTNPALKELRPTKNKSSLYVPKSAIPKPEVHPHRTNAHYRSGKR